MAFFPREGDGGTQRLGKGSWWWLVPVSTCASVAHGGMRGAAGRGRAPPLASAPLGARISIPNHQMLPEQDFQVEKEHAFKDIPLSLQLPIACRPR